MNKTNETSARPPLTRTLSMPNTPQSPLATNPWYRQKFEFVCHSNENFDFLLKSIF